MAGIDLYAPLPRLLVGLGLLLLIWGLRAVIRDYLFPGDD
jgi:hypothetical protein